MTGRLIMKFFASNPTTWVAKDGTVRTETAAQRELVATLAFQIALGLHKKAVEKDLPSDDRLGRLNQALESAKDSVPKSSAAVQP